MTIAPLNLEVIIFEPKNETIEGSVTPTPPLPPLRNPDTASIRVNSRNTYILFKIP